jgi:hypothetical protein
MKGIRNSVCQRDLAQEAKNVNSNGYTGAQQTSLVDDSHCRFSVNDRVNPDRRRCRFASLPYEHRRKPIARSRLLNGTRTGLLVLLR